ncbi:MAG: hypothetical protein KAH38_02580, partial [Candidatus Hydrogenedentes bacterium]|nr:hypothetical protein [Candidatus Hydrogenedentota bacterium]
VTNLAKEQLEFDLGSEAVITARGSVTEVDGQPALQIGECAYTAVIIPAEMENLDRGVFDLLTSYLEKGGVVFSCAAQDVPAYIDGNPDDACTALRANDNWKIIAPEEVTARINEHCKPSVEVILDTENQAIVYHHRRQLADGDILFIANISNDSGTTGNIISHCEGFREIDLDTGDIYGYESVAAADGQLHASFSIPPCGSIMLFLDKKEIPAAIQTSPIGEANLLPLSDIEIQRLDDNNLILDYVDIAAGKASASKVFWKEAAALTFKENGLRGNIWDHCVQFRDELLQTQFEADSGFTAHYNFTIEGSVPTELYAVIERADLYTITCNGKTVAAENGSWWLDRS